MIPSFKAVQEAVRNHYPNAYAQGSVLGLVVGRRRSKISAVNTDVRAPVVDLVAVPVGEGGRVHEVGLDDSQDGSSKNLS